ncbi:hypothetical protein V3C99_010476 [Haemonchus contortus]
MFSIEFFLIVIIIVLTSILFCLSVSAIVILRCYDPKEIHVHDIPATILARTRQSVSWARSSIFSRPSVCPDVSEDVEGQQINEDRTFLKPRTSVAV